MSRPAECVCFPTAILMYVSRYVLAYTIYFTIFPRCHYPAARRDGSMTGRDKGVDVM